MNTFTFSIMAFINTDDRLEIKFWMASFKSPLDLDDKVKEISSKYRTLKISACLMEIT